MTTSSNFVSTSGPSLPQPRGDLSSHLAEHLQADPATRSVTGAWPSPRRTCDPLTDDDFQLALYMCYELHYTSFAGVHDEWEWHPALVRFCQALETEYVASLHEAVSPLCSIDETLESVLYGPSLGKSVSAFLEERGQLWHLQEYVVHRSAYHLKEADPHTWAIPRLHGGPKAALITLQFDEYGAGRLERMHSQLFAQTMTHIGLSPDYGTYLNQIPGTTLSTVNLLTLFGLHRKWRGAIVGSLAVAEIKSSPGSARLTRCLRRLGLPTEAAQFFLEHVEADAVHEQIVRREVIAGLLRLDPSLASSIAFGAQATIHTGDMASSQMVSQWEAAASSLRAA